MPEFLSKLKSAVSYPPFGLFLKANLFLLTIIFSLFLLFNHHYNALNFTLVLFGGISTAVTLYLIIYIVTFIFRLSKKSFFLLNALLFVLSDLALIVDFFIYKTFNFHINAMVVNIITSPSAFDSIQVGYAPVVAFVLIVLFLIAFEIVIYKLTLRYNNAAQLNKRLNKALFLPLLAIILIEKIAYGYTNLMGYNDIYSKFKVIPLYQPLTFNKLAYKLFGYKKQTIQNNIHTGQLNYPLEPIQVTLNAKKYNVFIIASDAARNDYITPQIAPNLTEFKKDAIVFNHNYSGGNATRFGIFSLFYALHSTYWFSFLDAKKGPVFFDTLDKLGYETHIITSTNTDWPEFKQTCYVNEQKAITDHFDGIPAQKDKASSAYLRKVIDDYDHKKPLFSFLFMDSPHGYSYLPEFNKFHAHSAEINYMKVAKNSPEVENAKAAYKNAIFYNDYLFGQIIKELKEKKLYDNSLIIFTSDHGQEFYEYGFFGHNTAFSKAQLNTPLIIKLPKDLNVSLPADFPNTYTSHNDIIPSILSLLGVKNNPQRYSNGYNLFDKNYHRNYLFSANWNDNAIITKKYTYIFSNTPNKMFSNEVRSTKTYKKVHGQVIDSKILLDVINKNKLFLK
jgi:membrane-anchored protein YejM (alkaline phosphatase superfamily)